MEEMNARRMMSALLAGLDLANIDAEEHRRDRPWKVRRIDHNSFEVIALLEGKTFSVTVQEIK